MSLLSGLCLVRYSPISTHVPIRLLHLSNPLVWPCWHSPCPYFTSLLFIIQPCLLDIFALHNSALSARFIARFSKLHRPSSSLWARLWDAEVKHPGRRWLQSSEASSAVGSGTPSSGNTKQAGSGCRTKFQKYLLTSLSWSLRICKDLWGDQIRMSLLKMS